MLCRKACGWQHVTRQLLQAPLWRIAYSGSNATFNGRTKTIRSHESRAFTSTARLSQTAFGIITTDAPSLTSIEQLLEPLRNAQAWDPNNASLPSTSSQLVLLLSPSFASHALDNELPVKAWKLLQERVGDTGTNVEMTVAVVDRLPSNTPALSKLDYGFFSAEQRGADEGMAYLIASSPETGIRVNEAMERTDKDLIPPLRGKPGNLSFSLPNSLVPSKSDRAVAQQVLELPLAQTTFSTGRVSTLIKTTYTRNGEHDLKVNTQAHAQSLQLDLSHITDVTLPWLHLPLQPLTPPRQVKYSMGNILRQLWHGDATHTASEELEQSVSSYFDALGLKAQAVAVWALIVPASSAAKTDAPSAHHLLGTTADTIQKQWSLIRDKQSVSYELQQTIDEGVLSLLYQGAKLCRVLSGGGGWGKKAGLLSLDPDNSYGPVEQGGIQANPRRGFDAEPLTEDTPSAFGQIAEVGDSVMFFIAPHDLDGWKADTDLWAVTELRNDSDEASEVPAFCFGALPSSIDSTPEITEKASGPTITHTPNSFGMLSEGGMAMKISMANSEELKPPTWGRTKVDVPHARFTGTPVGATWMEATVSVKQD